MTVQAIAGLVACSLFGVAMLHVVATDLRHRRIRNWLMIALAVGYPPLAVVAGLPAVEIAAAASAAAVVFAAGVGCFAAGWVGGGDVKLAAVAALWLGAAQTLPFLLLTSVLGIALTGGLLLAASLGRRRTRPEAARRATPRTVPYGPALAVAAIALLPGSPWAAIL